MTRRHTLLLYAVVLLVGLMVATQWVGYRLAYHPALGGLRVGRGVVYPPWALLVWGVRYGRDVPRALDEGYAIVTSAAVLATVALAVAGRVRRRIPVREVGRERWATERDMRAAGLLGGRGVVLGRVDQRYLTYDGPEHQLVSGASRSGKGVGHVIPTLLNWPGSVLAYDVKNELWDVTAGFRATLGSCLFFNPTRPDSARFNPLLEVRKGPAEVRDAQNLVEMLTNPTGAKQSLDVWDQQAGQLLVALVLHVLYTEPDDRKTLFVVRQRLLDFRRTAADMTTARHRLNPATGEPEPHPEVAQVAAELLRQPEKFRASVCGTAASYLTLWADEVVARNTSASDFRLGDLACASKPMTLYLQPPPSDAPRLRPLVRLVLNQACRALMEHLDADGSGRPKRHRLLLSLDEFPTLGRLDFFTSNLRQMAGYGLKAHLIVQSFNDVVEQYGPHNTILDNCHVLTAFAAADPVTCQRVSQMTGTVTEYRESYSQPGRQWTAARTVSHSEQVRPLLAPGDVRELPADEQLVFVTGVRPMRVKKVRYYEDPTFRARLLPAPAGQVRAEGDAELLATGWAGERAKGTTPGPVSQPVPAATAPESEPDEPFEDADDVADDEGNDIDFDREDV